MITRACEHVCLTTCVCVCPMSMCMCKGVPVSPCRNECVGRFVRVCACMIMCVRASEWGVSVSVPWNCPCMYVCVCVSLSSVCPMNE